MVGAGGLLHTEMATVKGKFAYDIPRRGCRPIYARVLVERPYEVRYSDLPDERCGNSEHSAMSPALSAVYYTFNEKHLANSLSVKSDTKGSFDFDLSVSRYDYLEDIHRSPFGAVPNSAAFTPYGKIARMDGTNWTIMGMRRASGALMMRTKKSASDS